MARVIPAGWQALVAALPAGTRQRELETLRQLADALPDSFAVFHGVHWTRVSSGTALVGEIDFAIVAPSGQILLIEQKSGFLQESDTGLVTLYAREEKSVPSQLARYVDALTTRLHATCAPEKPRVEALLYCPDHTLKSPGSAGIDPARIVDATRRDHLIAIVRHLLPDAPENPALARTIEDFFADLLQLVPEVNAVAGEADALYTRLAGGLAEWGRQLEFSPFRLRVQGTAGSGKTQLALAVFRDALAAGRRPLYVCFNRPLADHLSRIAPTGGTVTTYHALCRHVAETRGQLPNFASADAFDRLESLIDHAIFTDTDRYDALIVDEGQDFKPGWADNLLRLLRPAGQAWWLEDPMQNLYGRPPTELPGWVTLHADTNYRTPAEILSVINRLIDLDRPLRAGSPLTGSAVDLVTYANDADLITQTKRAITQAIGAGFKRPMIALLTYRGREHSRMMSYDRLGPYPLRRFTGRYDLLGAPEISDGDVLIESVLRFKGQAAPCVILTEIDFADLDAAAQRRLFVGATRATMKLVLIASEAASRPLRTRLAERPG